MAYKNGKTYQPKRTKDLKKALDSKDTETILWITLRDSLEDMEEAKEPRYGKTFLSFAIQQLATTHGRKISKGIVGGNDEDKKKSNNLIEEWLKMDAPAEGGEE